MRTIGDVKREIERSYQKLGNWRLVAEKFGLSKGMVYRIAVQDYEPKDVHIRTHLGLVSYGRARVCVKCGVVHTTRRCTARPKAWSKKLWDTPVDELRWRFVHREEIKTALGKT